jgi:MFS family permease
MAGATIAPALPAMQVYFTTGPGSESATPIPGVDYLVRLALTLPALLIALGAPVVGIIIDRLGRKPLLLIALLLYGLAGSSGFVLSSLQLILVGRAILGTRVAGIMVTATTLIADYYSGSARAQFLGLQAAFMGLGGVLFLSLGGLLADLNWRFPFLIYLMAWVLLPCALAFLPEPERYQSTPIPPGGVAPVPEPLPIELIALTYGIAVVTQTVFYLIPVQLPFYLKQLVQANAAQSGLAIALSTLFSAISALFFSGAVPFTLSESTAQSSGGTRRNLRFRRSTDAADDRGSAGFAVAVAIVFCSNLHLCSLTGVPI